tara:strand:+ start:1684 stop:2106 length:423 start_codon:yes stop_codon:yes gene_type:complete
MAKKKQKYHSFYEDGIRYMECSVCGTFEENIDKLTKSIVCSDCFMKMALNLWDPMENIKTGPKKAKGWHWMKEFVDSDGNVFHKGKEMPKLKGTLTPTKIKNVVRKKKKKESYEKKIKLLAKEHKQKQKLKKEQQIGINK